MGQVKHLHWALTIITLVVALSGLAVAVGPTFLDGPVTVQQTGDRNAKLCLKSDTQEDCLEQSSGNGFYHAAPDGHYVRADDGTGSVFSIPGVTPLLRALWVISGNDATTAGPPMLYRTAPWSGNVCIWAGAASNEGLVVYIEDDFPPGWQNGSIMSSVVAKPGTLRPVGLTWLDGDPLDGQVGGIITDLLGEAPYNRCYRVNVWAVADGPG